MPEKLIVAVLFGGRSSEHSISCATAGGVLAAIDRSKYDVIPVGITRDGAFTLQSDDAACFARDTGLLHSVADNGSRVLWPDSAASKMLRVVAADGGVSDLGEIDVVFPILHGRFGEDGTVQGLFELLDLSYVGAGVLGSALGMDKHFTKTVLEHAGLAVAPWITVTTAQWKADAAAVAARVVAEFEWPVFVKPARAGSSVGVSKAVDPHSLAIAIGAGLAEDSKVLVETALVGREIECAVIAGRDGGAPRVSVAGEIVTPADAFYDFESKYLDPHTATLVCPAEITAHELLTMQDLAARAFLAIDGTGLARVDFFLTDEGFVINELNTMPGFTPISMFPKCWLASGLSYPELLDELIHLGLTTAR